MPKVKAPAKGEELLAQLETRLRETYGEGDPDDIPVGWEKHPLAGVTYFQRDEGCLNEGSVIGDVEELERGIIKLFYTYFDPIRTAVEKELNIKMPEWAIRPMGGATCGMARRHIIRATHKGGELWSNWPLSLQTAI